MIKISVWQGDELKGRLIGVHFAQPAQAISDELLPRISEKARVAVLSRDRLLMEAPLDSKGEFQAVLFEADGDKSEMENLLKFGSFFEKRVTTA